MKKIMYVLISIAVFTVVIYGCKSLAKSAARYWTKKQVKEFRSKCENGTIGKIGNQNVAEFCKCASSLMQEKYHNYEEAKTKSIIEVLGVAKDCAKK